MENLNKQQKLLLRAIVWSVISGVIGLILAELYINPPHTKFQEFLGNTGIFIAIISGIVAAGSFISFLVIFIAITIKEGKN